MKYVLILLVGVIFSLALGASEAAASYIQLTDSKGQAISTVNFGVLPSTTTRNMSPTIVFYKYQADYKPGFSWEVRVYTNNNPVVSGNSGLVGQSQPTPTIGLKISVPNHGGWIGSTPPPISGNFQGYDSWNTFWLYVFDIGDGLLVTADPKYFPSGYLWRWLNTGKYAWTDVQPSAFAADFMNAAGQSYECVVTYELVHY